MITDLRNANVLPFDYEVDISLTANQSAQKILTLAADSSFELHEILGMSSLDNGTLFAPNFFSLQITDQSTGRQLQSAKVPQRILCGNAFFARPLRRAVVFPPSANVTFEFTNLDGGNTPNVVFMTLRGYKIFQMSQK